MMDLHESSSPPVSAPAQRPQVHLPRFSDVKDIEEFVNKLAEFEAGALTPEQFRAFRLTRGVYGQRQEGTQMLRVKIPLGRASAAQLVVLGEIADRFARGLAHVTTRQNIQFHFVKMNDVEAAMRRLDEVGITTREACGHSVRNVTACARAGVCEGAAFDTTPWAEALVRYFLRHRLASTLPRKFKIAFSGCPDDCASAAINDLGFVAMHRDGVPGFKVLVAGGLSTSPEAALTLHDFVPAPEIARVGESILRLFDALGNRENKHRARLKYVRRKLGEAGFREKYQDIYAEVGKEGITDLAPAHLPPPVPAGAVSLDVGAAFDATGFETWRASAVRAQRPGEPAAPRYVSVSVRLSLGDIRSDELRTLAKLADRFGDGSAVFSIDQNVLLPWVDERSLEALYAELSAHGLARVGMGTARDVTSCPGAETCNLAVTASRSLADAIADRLSAADAEPVRSLAASIKISGCPNSCGQHHVADLGWHGGAKTVNGVTVPVYQLHLGGGVDARGARFGRQVVKVVARRVPDAVVLLLALYRREKENGESVAAFFQRVEGKRVVEALGSLLGAPGEDESRDIGETSGFKIAGGEGECAA